ncbi:hypothetical protein AGMMS49965_19200 [Bacteroidia bacterium]|nr:hypothetical protein AGMMS49965_19200 [Bacteroidia bacterium]
MKHYSIDTISKIGNTAVYLSERISDLSKTKLLKLLYLIEECSAIKNNKPFFGISFEVWQAGPVAKDFYIDLSDENQPVLLSEFITKTDNENGSTYIHAKLPFCDDEFSDKDIEVLEDVIRRYGDKTAKQLVEVTHNENSAWYSIAKENELLDDFTKGRKNHSDKEIDFTYYLSGCSAERYLENKETLELFESLKH